MELRLEVFRDDEVGRFGVLLANVGKDKHFLGYTVEQPWKNNMPFHSCVPSGKYDLVPYRSDKYGECYLLSSPDCDVYPYQSDTKSVSDRYLCIFAHKGNYPHNFQGCIGIGEDYLPDHNMVTRTKDTVKYIMNMLYDSDEKHTLKIIL